MLMVKANERQKRGIIVTLKWFLFVQLSLLRFVNYMQIDNNTTTDKKSSSKCESIQCKFCAARFVLKEQKKQRRRQ